MMEPNVSRHSHTNAHQAKNVRVWIGVLSPASTTGGHSARAPEMRSSCTIWVCSISDVFIACAHANHVAMFQGLHSCTYPSKAEHNLLVAADALFVEEVSQLQHHVGRDKHNNPVIDEGQADGGVLARVRDRVQVDLGRADRGCRPGLPDNHRGVEAGQQRARRRGEERRGANDDFGEEAGKSGAQAARASVHFFIEQCAPARAHFDMPEATLADAEGSRDARDDPPRPSSKTNENAPAGLYGAEALNAAANRRADAPGMATHAAWYPPSPTRRITSSNDEVTSASVPKGVLDATRASAWPTTPPSKSTTAMRRFR